MAVRMTMELPITIEQYEEVDGKVGHDPPPDGLLVHSAVDNGGTVKVVDIWESAEKFNDFAQNTLGPIAAEVLGGDGPPPDPQIEEVHHLEVHGG